MFILRHHKKSLLIVAVLTVLSLAATAAFAQPLPNDSSTDFASIFSIPADDVSRLLLNYLFGQMEGLLSGGGSVLLGKMFSIFNSTVLAVGGMLILYTLVVSILNTAHEGNVMGQKWSSMWIPIRAALGIALLLPKESGYSIIQIIIMWVVLQGVGAADSVWGTIVDYVNEQGATVGNVAQTPAELQKKVIDVRLKYMDIIKAVGCKNAINRAADTTLIVQNSPVISETKVPIRYDKGGNPLIDTTVNTYSVSFGGAPDSTINSNVCGTVTWTPQEKTFDGTYASAIARLFANAETLTNAALTDSDNAVPIKANGTANINAAQNSITSANMYLLALQNLGSPPKVVISQTQKEQGWIIAGSYYHLLAKNNALKEAAQRVNTPKVKPGAGPSGVINELGFNKGKADNYMAYIDKVSERSMNNGGDALPISGPGKVDLDWTGGKPELKFVKDLIGPIGDAIGKFTMLMKDPKGWVGNWIVQPTTDPVVQVQKFGQELLQTVEDIWFWGGIALFAANLLLSIGGSANPLPFSILSFLIWITPLVMSILLFVFIGGAMLAYFVPLLPFLIFTFGALGWLLSVIEAIVAGPLVALGVLHPEGHEVWGEAKPAIMLLVGIFLRPVLLVFGLITAISVSYAAVSLTNLGFSNIIDTLYFGNWLSSIISGIALIMVYVSIIVAVLTFTARLITQLPNHVLRWIGGGNEGYGEDQMVGEVQRGISQGMEGVGGAFQQGARGMGDLAKGQASQSKPKGGGVGGGDDGGGGGGGGDDQKKEAAETAAKAALL